MHWVGKLGAFLSGQCGWEAAKKEQKRKTKNRKKKKGQKKKKEK